MGTTSSRKDHPETTDFIGKFADRLKDDFGVFASKIGFSENQVDEFKKADPGISRQALMERWLQTAGKHTTRHAYIVYKALESVKRTDLIKEYFRGGVPEQHADDIWDDFVAELHGIDVANLQHDKTEDVRPKTTKKKRRQKQGEIPHESTVKVKDSENIQVGDHCAMNVTSVHISTLNVSVSNISSGDADILKQLEDILKSKRAIGLKKVKLQSLESCFLQRSGKAFDNITGKPLLSYLQQHSDIFSLKKQSEQWFVCLHENPSDATGASASSVQNQFKPRRNTSVSKSSRGNNVKRNTNTSSNNNQSFTRPIRQSQAEKVYLQNKCREFDDFLLFVDHFRDGNFLLMISQTDYTKHEDALANIPWICVLDFDTDSRTDGLFYRIEDTLRKHRSVYPCTWHDVPNIQTWGTEWCFIKGSSHSPDSKSPDNFKQWYPSIQHKFEDHIKELVSFLDTVNTLTVVAFWPENQTEGKRFQKIISILNDNVRPGPQTVVIGNPSQEHNALIDLIEPDYFLKDKIENVFHDLSNNMGNAHEFPKSEYCLPTSDGTYITGIDDTLATSFRETMQVLYRDNPFRTVYDLSTSEEEEKMFFKGGTLSWQAYYNNGPDHFYVSRDLLIPIETDIQHFIDECQSGVIQIYHAPGAGGTTLAQKLLWDFHKKTPCVQVRSDSRARSKQIAEKISLIYEKTHLPVVILFDGPEDKLFNELRKRLDHVIVIFIRLKRVSVKDESKLGKHEYFLPGSLTPNEAIRIGPKFIRCCHGDVAKKDQLQKLVHEVEAGMKHHLIEFGLVTYLHEYTGVSAFVSEYLNLNEHDLELKDFQKVMGYLSLVEVFGQTTLPCQLFGTMLGKSPDYKFTYAKFPQSIKEFTVPVKSGFMRNDVRICHYLIAIEILEQVLSKRRSKERGQELSSLAKNNLQSFILQFIGDLKRRQNQIGLTSKVVFDIVLQTFIYREDKMNSECSQYKRRPDLSRLLESIPSEQPYTERLQVLEVLAESFPDNPNLWAHVGRAYSIFRPTEWDKTEEFFQKAFTLFRQQDDMPNIKGDEIDLSRSYSFHMYGSFYLKRIQLMRRNWISNTGDKSEMEFQDVVREMFNHGKTACEAFSVSRKLGFAGFQESFGCLGEINVRLDICRFLKLHYKYITIPDLLDKSKNKEITSFVEESLTLVQQLFMQCYNIVDRDQIDDGFYEKVKLYIELFRGMVPTVYIDNIKIPDTIKNRCVVISAIKLKYGKDDHLGTVDDITDEGDVKLVVELLERNFEDIRKTGEIYSKMGLDFDFLDWIYVIRHPKQKNMYTVEKVLTKVRYWYECLRSPYSQFYLSILLCTLGINRQSPDTEIVQEALNLKENFEVNNMSKNIPNPQKPREWLGNEPGIRCLLPGKTYISRADLNFVDDEAANYKIIVWKGTICPPNSYRQTGLIDLDLGSNCSVSIKVHFCPFRTKEKLVGMAHAGRRIEFMLAFTAGTGYEAYNVKLLKKSLCQKCESKVEILSVRKAITCKCGEWVENEFPLTNT